MPVVPTEFAEPKSFYQRPTQQQGWCELTIWETLEGKRVTKLEPNFFKNKHHLMFGQ